MTNTNCWQRVWAIVRRIPPGRVMTYGDISDRMHGRISPAAVGWALKACPDDVPWQRVVNREGRVSTSPVSRQQHALEAEGVEFDGDRLALERYRHRGDRP